MNKNISRRQFLKTTTRSAAVVTIGFNLPISRSRAEALGGAPGAGLAVTPNAWLTINTDNSVTILSSAGEMGQGSFTSLPMMIAEEMELLPSQVLIEHAPVGPAYINLILRFQGTGGSASVRGMFDHLRQVGADTREWLKQAAAIKWGVDVGEITVKAGTLEHKDGLSLTYAEIAPYAKEFDMPSGSSLKPKSEWNILGTSFKRKDTPSKVVGEAEFGVDVKIEGMLVATVQACPTFGGKLVSVDPEPAMAVKGVHNVVSLDNAIAVCAKDYWAAQKGLKALEPLWDLGPNASVSTDSVREEMQQQLEKAGIEALNFGDINDVRQKAERVHSVVYEAPNLAHATMEPMNATVDASSEMIKVWAPCQTLAGAQLAVAKALQVSPEKIDVQATFMGGGFGRKASPDTVVQAALISKQVAKPVKLIWSREEDMTRGFYRPMALMRMQAHLDKDDKAMALEIRSACQSIARLRNPKAEKDGSIKEGLSDTDYAFDANFVDYHILDTAMPVWFWRSVGYSQNTWAVESYVDELARLEGVDPYLWRRQRLSTHERKKNVLDKAAQEANWGEPAEGRVQGIAIAHSFGSIVAQVVEAQIADNGQIKIDKITCVVDCGLAIDPGAIRAQMEGSIVYGLTAAMYGKIDIKNGAAVQNNFPQYEMMRIRHMPIVNVHIIESTGVPGGIGEPGLPPAAPALCNAIYAATGKPIHKLPLSGQGFSFT